jgi:hypothetical protein
MEAAQEGAPGAEPAVAAPAERGRREILLAAALSLAVLATAWCAYQATLWGGEMVRDFQRAGALRSQAMRLSLEGGQFALADITIGVEWLAAELNGNQQLAAELRGRMSPELDAAMDDWLKDRQPGDPIPASGPFQAGRYTARGTEEAVETERQAAAAFEEGQDANRRADNYVLTGVLFALVLFFAGLAAKVTNPKLAEGLAYMTATIAALGMVFLLLQPQRISI